MGKDMFEAVSAANDKRELKWDKLCGVTTEGAPADRQAQTNGISGMYQGKRLGLGC